MEKFEKLSTDKHGSLIIKELCGKVKNKQACSDRPTTILTIEKEVNFEDYASQPLTQDKVQDWLAGPYREISQCTLIPQQELLKPFGFRKPDGVVASAVNKVTSKQVPEFQPGETYYKLLRKLSKSAAQKEKENLLKERQERKSFRQDTKTRRHCNNI